MPNRGRQTGASFIFVLVLLLLIAIMVVTLIGNVMNRTRELSDIRFQSDLEDIRTYVLGNALCPNTCVLGQTAVQQPPINVGDLPSDFIVAASDGSPVGGTGYFIRARCVTCTDSPCPETAKTKRIAVEFRHAFRVGRDGLTANWKELFRDSDRYWCTAN